MVKESLGSSGSSDVGDWSEPAGVASSWERYNADGPSTQQRSQLVRGPHALVGQGRGLATGGPCELPREADGGGPRQEAELQRDEFRRRDLGRLQDRMHVIGQCPKSRHHLAGPKAVPCRPEVGGQELADGLVKHVGDLLTLDFRGHVGINGRGLLAGRVEAPEHQVAEAGCGDGGVPGAPPCDQGGSEGIGVLGDIFRQRAALRKRQGDMLDNFHFRRARGDRNGGCEQEPPWRPCPCHGGDSLDASICRRPS